jgi:GT2 family glycosyltransferase
MKTLGIAIPYYKNSEVCEEKFKILLETIYKQLYYENDILCVIYEDGQQSEWITDYTTNNIIQMYSCINQGVSHARNECIDFLINEVNYILFLDSDDIIDDNYLEKMLKACKNNKYEIYESNFLIHNKKIEFKKNVRRYGVVGSAISTKIINDVRFDEDLQIGEDTKFMIDTFDIEKHNKKLVNTNYRYNLGVNRNSLTMLYQRGIIKEKRN